MIALSYAPVLAGCRAETPAPSTPPSARTPSNASLRPSSAEAELETMLGTAVDKALQAELSK